jgi:putative membrane protein
MKKTTITTGSLLMTMLFITSSFRNNELGNADNNVTKFLTEAADARLMDSEEGKLARERGTTEEIRSYGRWMMRDQSKLLQEIKYLSKEKGIKLSGKLSEEKAKGLEDLRREQGSAFDKKFAKMICLDHKRDVKKFKKATKFEDADVKKFAVQYLPTIESHLERIKEIEKEK